MEKNGEKELKQQHHQEVLRQGKWPFPLGSPVGDPGEPERVAIVGQTQWFGQHSKTG